MLGNLYLFFHLHTRLLAFFEEHETKLSICARSAIHVINFFLSCNFISNDLVEYENKK